MMAGGYDNTLTISSSMTNVAHDILRLTAPVSAHLAPPAMDVFDHDLNFEGENLLCLFPSSALPYLHSLGPCGVN